MRADEYGPATYGDRIAGIYDRYVEPFVGEKTGPTINFPAGLAGGGRVLELGIGTGRIALPHAWPSELDLRARLADMRLRNRFGGWQHEPFTSASAFHVSAYERIKITQ